MTYNVDVCANNEIIPYQELLGNYDGQPDLLGAYKIIPYQELLGNYDNGFTLQA